MKKFNSRIVAAGLCLAIGASLAVGAYAGVNANPSTHKVTVNGAASDIKGYNIDGDNYFKIRDVGQALDLGVTWDASTSTVGLDSDSHYKVDEKTLIQGNWAPATRTRIQAVIDANADSGKYVVFDFDNTSVIFDVQEALLIYQIGTLYCDEKTGYDTHMHKNFFELTAVTGGQGEVSANGNPIAVRSGDIFLSYPFDTHKIVSDPADPLRYHFLAFDTVNEPFRYQLERVTKEFTAPAERLFCDGEILSSLGRAVYELDGGEAFHTEYCSRLLDCVLIRLLRHYFPSGKDFHKPGREEMLVFSVMNSYQ